MSQQQQPKVHDASDFPIVRLEGSSIYEVRIPRDGGHDSMLMADSVPA
ncbi:TPA: hypothetical protein ACVGNE_004219 [Pseudomonas aeruginosa]